MGQMQGALGLACAAVEGGQVSVLELLLDSGINTESKDFVSTNVDCLKLF